MVRIGARPWIALLAFDGRRASSAVCGSHDGNGVGVTSPVTKSDFAQRPQERLRAAPSSRTRGQVSCSLFAGAIFEIPIAALFPFPRYATSKACGNEAKRTTLGMN